jgi:hypothetical protein
MKIAEFTGINPGTVRNILPKLVAEGTLGMPLTIGNEKRYKLKSHYKVVNVHDPDKNVNECE